VAELRQAAFDIMCDGPGQLTAGEAWWLVVNHMRIATTIFRDGKRRYRKPLSAEIEAAVRAIGGWERLGNSDNDIADRARFIEAYNMLAKRRRDTTLMLSEVRELTKRLAMDRLALEG